jgi:hypothetical protein
MLEWTSIALPLLALILPGLRGHLRFWAMKTGHYTGYQQSIINSQYIYEFVHRSSVPTIIPYPLAIRSISDSKAPKVIAMCNN